MTRKTINVLRDFSRYPGGRYKTDGNWSAERLRDSLIVPALLECDIVVLEMDGPLGYHSPFLEEVFGGLVRLLGTDVLDRIEIVTEDERMISKIRQYMIEEYARQGTVVVQKHKEEKSNPRETESLLSVADAIAIQEPDPKTRFGLTKRETEVVEHVGKGLTPKEIAEALFISKRTVDFHLDNIYKKVNKNRRTAVAFMVLREDIPMPGETGRFLPERTPPAENPAVSEKPKTKRPRRAIPAYAE